MPQYKIVPTLDNPSTADLIDAFHHAFDGPGVRRTVTFRVADEPGYKRVHGDDQLRGVEVQVTSLAYESGTPGMFCLAGNVVVDGKTSGQMEGFYDGSRRSGHLNRK